MEALNMQQPAPVKTWGVSLQPNQFAFGADRQDLISVPVFPRYRPLVLEDKPLFDGILRLFPPQVSELTFTNLFSWRRAYGFVVSSLLGYLLVGSSKGETLSLLDPIGPIPGKKAVIEECFKRSPDGAKLRFMRLPSETADLFAGDNNWAVEEDEDNSDYVYRAEDLIFLKGGAFDGKRNLIKRFQKSGNFEYAPLTEADIEESLSFQESWCQLRDCANTHGLATERQALQEMLVNFQALGLVGGVIRREGKIVALSLGEKLNPDTLVVHIEKADGSLPGVYQALNALFSASASAGLSFINREQDLGIPGLRQAKQSYHPHHMVRKYNLLQV